jgi:SAM-dependent methyltransferase
MKSRPTASISSVSGPIRAQGPGIDRRQSCVHPIVNEAMGTGPGAITNDGCPVEFYAMLPEFGEPEIVHRVAPPTASILELGCGTGRILRPLAALGHLVTGVDDSPAMLALSPDLPTICSPIESLRLGRKFNVVLLASAIINAHPVTRLAFLSTVRRHLHDDGIAVFQQSPPDWFDTFEKAEPVWDDPLGFRRTIRVARRDGSRMRVEVEYQVGDRVWSHAWTSYEISDAEVASDLANAGLTLTDWLTNDHAWFTARPA